MVHGIKLCGQSSSPEEIKPTMREREEEGATTKASSSSSSQWLRLNNNKDPRIVRVSRASGVGKDKHSKVMTVRGVRDRRVRLSVPTAIHLYDLQHRLGLTQPSKVVDWLLNEARHEIHNLPPLLPIIPPGNATWKSSNPNHHQENMPTGNSYQWDPLPNSVSQADYGIGNYQTDLGGGSTTSQMLVFPPPGAARSFPPSHVAAAAAMENMDPIRQISNHYHHQNLMSPSSNSHQSLSMIFDSPDNNSENHSTRICLPIDHMQI